MTGPRTRFIGPRATEVLTVDYTTVLHQAVENERQRVLREVRNALKNTSTSKPATGRDSWRDDPRNATDFRDEMYKHLDTLEAQPR